MNKYEQIKTMTIEDMAKEFMLAANWDKKDKAKADKIFGKNNVDLYIEILSKEVIIEQNPYQIAYSKCTHPKMNIEFENKCVEWELSNNKKGY